MFRRGEERAKKKLAASKNGVVGMNEMVAPIVLRICLLRSGEAGKKAGVDFASGGH